MSEVISGDIANELNASCLNCGTHISSTLSENDVCIVCGLKVKRRPTTSELMSRKTHIMYVPCSDTTAMYWLPCYIKDQ